MLFPSLSHHHTNYKTGRKQPGHCCDVDADSWGPRSVVAVGFYDRASMIMRTGRMDGSRLLPQNTRGPCELRLRRQGTTDRILISGFCLQHCLVQNWPSVEQQIGGATTVGISNLATLLAFPGLADPYFAFFSVLTTCSARHPFAVGSCS